MPSIYEERDVDLVHQALRVVETENGHLHRMLAELVEELAALKGEVAAEQLELRRLELEDKLKKYQRLAFGGGSERRPRNPKADKQDESKRPSDSEARPQEQLELEEVPHELAEDERTCTCCGRELTEWEGQDVESEEVDVIERVFVLKKHRRKKYRCRCGAAPVTAPGPLKLPGGGRYSLGFAISVVISKWLDGLPLERQVRIMQREGLDVTSGTLWEQAERLSRVLAATAMAILTYVRSADLVNVDESRWKLLVKGAKAHWLWTFARHDAAYYRIEDSRGHEVIVDTLGRDFEGVMMSDDFSAYTTAHRKMPKAVRGGCWAHARRHFTDIVDDYPECEEVIQLIGELFLIERDLPKWEDIRDSNLRAQALSQIREVRQAQSRPLCDQIHAWIGSRRVLRAGAFGNALKYLGAADNWWLFTRFLEDARIPLSNNHAERELRGPIVGRKNFHGCKSERGLEVAEVFYTLLESAKLAGVEPRAYLRAAAEAALTDEAPLLPHLYKRQLSSV